MARHNPICSIMDRPLPSITYQLRLSFRPCYKDITHAYNMINKHIFDNVLRRPKIEQGIRRNTWGFCMWEDLTDPSTGSSCKIFISDKWFCPQWFMQTLAHEMVHQYQWDHGRQERLRVGLRRELCGDHGPSFFEWRDKFAYYGLDLKTAHGRRRWFKHQDFSKC